MLKPISEKVVLKKADNICWLKFPFFEQFPQLAGGLVTRSSWNFFDTSGLLSGLKKFFANLGLDTENILLFKQVHKSRISIVKKNSGLEKTPFLAQFDASLTDQRDVILTVQVADCLPVYFYNPVKNVIGVVHSGWRGTLQQIVKKTLEKASEVYKTSAGDFRVILGPCIGKCCFEVDAEVGILFREYEKPVVPEEKKFRLDLARLNVTQLLEAGVKRDNIFIVDQCTSCRPDSYYSYRRTGNRQEMMLGFLALKSC